MTGYRIGFVAAPVELAGAVGRLHSQLTGSPNAVSQAAYQAALETEPEELAAMRAEFAERRRVLLEGLERLGLETPEPRGAFYAFPDVSRYLDERGSVGLCEDLLETSGLSLVPGEAFGLPSHVRLSYAKPVRDVREALRRLEAFLERRR
jgi:aspartate aminotransferase